MKKNIYRSKIDWWVWLVTAGFIAALIFGNPAIKEVR